MIESKLTVAVVAYKRRDYLRQSLDALAACDGFEDIVDRVVASVDDCYGQGRMCLADLNRWKPEMKSHGPGSIGIYGQARRSGIVGNTILAMTHAFSDPSTQNVLMLEDDAVLKTDALKLSQWFCNANFQGVVALGLGNHRDHAHTEQLHVSVVDEFNYLPCPFAYVITRKHWKFAFENWCIKEYHPCGWSWSLSYAARTAGFTFMAPWLSRCENIGRDGGENESPESFDLTQRNISFVGQYDGGYHVINKLSESEIKRVDPWMEAEIAKDPARKWQSNDPWPGWLGYGCPPEVIELRSKDDRFVCSNGMIRSSREND